MNHVETVKHIYEAFGKGDISAILAHLSETVEWEYGLSSTDIPWLQPRKGRAAVAGFFEALREVEFESFEPTMILHRDDTVVALVDVAARIRATGRRIVDKDEAHIWHFDSEGRVERFRHQLDSHQHWAAYHDEAITRLPVGA